jgi:predicted amidohydrolase
MPFTLASVQLSSRLGEVEANLDHIAQAVAQAHQEGAHLALLPEAIVSGYFLEGANLESARTAEEILQGLVKRLGHLSSPPDVALGFYESADGRPANSAGYFDLQNQKVRHVHRKFFLPSYGVFDEARFCQAGNHVRSFETRWGRMGLLICEDVWHSILPTLLSVQGADLILVPAASPGRGLAGERPSNVERYDRLLMSVAEEHGVYASSSGHVGFEGGKGLSGVGFIYDPFGRRLAESPVMGESIVLAEIDLDVARASRAKSPLLSDLRSRWARVVEIAQESLPESPEGQES